MWCFSSNLVFCLSSTRNQQPLFRLSRIDLLAIQQKSLDQALFLYIFIREVQSSGVRASFTIVHIRKFCKM